MHVDKSNLETTLWFLWFTGFSWFTPWKQFHCNYSLSLHAFISLPCTFELHNCSLKSRLSGKAILPTTINRQQHDKRFELIRRALLLECTKIFLHWALKVIPHAFDQKEQHYAEGMPPNKENIKNNETLLPGMTESWQNENSKW